MPMMFQQERDGEPVTLPDSGRYGFGFLAQCADVQGGDLWKDGQHTVTEDLEIVDREDEDNTTFSFKKGDVLTAWRS